VGVPRLPLARKVVVHSGLVLLLRCLHLADMLLHCGLVGLTRLPLLSRTAVHLLLVCLARLLLDHELILHGFDLLRPSATLSTDMLPSRSNIGADLLLQCLHTILQGDSVLVACILLASQVVIDPSVVCLACLSLIVEVAMELLSQLRVALRQLFGVRIGQVLDVRLHEL